MTTPASTEPADDPELDELFQSLRDESRPMLALDRSQRDAWVSGLLAAWPDDQAHTFVTRCEADQSEVAQVLGVIARDLDNEGPRDPQESVAVTGCWLVEDSTATDSSASAVLEFRHTDDSGHCVMAEIDDQGHLVDLQLGPEADALLPDAESLAEVGSALTIHEHDPGTAAAAVVEGWQAAHRAGQTTGDVSDGILLNQRVVRRRLRSMVPNAVLPLFVDGDEEATVELHEGLSANEIAEANARSVGTLTRALAAVRQRPAPTAAGAEFSPAEAVAVAAGIMQAHGSGITLEERQSLAFLEWADWMGVVLGAVRGGPGVPVSGNRLVDLINRCPEVTTSISKKDRPYVAFALDVAVREWAAVGMVVEDALTELGWWVLPRAAAQAWGASFDG